MQTTIKRQSPPVNKGSKLFAIRRGAKVAATSVSPYLSHHACHRNTSSPYKRDYFNLPALFDLPWPFMTEAASKRCHELKSPISLSRSLSQRLFFLRSSSSSVYFVQTEIGSCKHFVTGSPGKEAKDRLLCRCATTSHAVTTTKELNVLWHTWSASEHALCSLHLIHHLVKSQLSFHATWMLLWLENKRLWVKFRRKWIYFLPLCSRSFTGELLSVTSTFPPVSVRLTDTEGILAHLLSPFAHL